MDKREGKSVISYYTLSRLKLIHLYVLQFLLYIYSQVVSEFCLQNVCQLGVFQIKKQAGILLCIKVGFFVLFCSLGNRMQGATGSAK